jgi:hypothetical protein
MSPSKWSTSTLRDAASGAVKKQHRGVEPGQVGSSFSRRQIASTPR